MRRRNFLALSAMVGASCAARVAPVGATSLDLDLVRDFGAAGDGVSDDTRAFSRMHTLALRAQAEEPQIEVNLTLPAGHTFLYRWNRWSWGLRRLNVRGHGAKLQCIAQSDWDIDRYALVTNRGFLQKFGYYEAAREADPADMGALIETASAGSSTVRLKPGERAHGLKAGSRVLIYSYSQQQNGFPPNARHFEQAVVTAVDGPEVHLDRALGETHRDDNPEPPNYKFSPAPARIMALDADPVALGIRHRYEGFTTLPSPYARAPAGSWDQLVRSWIQASGVLDTEFVDCDLCGLSPGEGLSVTVRNCTVQYSEPDKLLDRLRFEKCTLTKITSCAGVHEASFVDTTFKQPALIWAMRQRYESCRFEGASGGQAGLVPFGPQAIEAITAVDCTFTGAGDPDKSAVASLEPLPRFTIGREVTLEDGALRVALPADPGEEEAPGIVMVNGVRPGSTMTIKGEPGASVRVEAIRGDTRFAIFEVTASRPLRAGDVLEIRRLERITVVDPTLENVGQGPIGAIAVDWNGQQRGALTLAAR